MERKEGISAMYTKHSSVESSKTLNLINTKEVSSLGDTLPNIVNILLRIGAGVAGDGSVVRSMGCSSKISRFESKSYMVVHNYKSNPREHNAFF